MMQQSEKVPKPTCTSDGYELFPGLPRGPRTPCMPAAHGGERERTVSCGLCKPCTSFGVLLLVIVDGAAPSVQDAPRCLQRAQALGRHQLSPRTEPLEQDALPLVNEERQLHAAPVPGRSGPLQPRRERGHEQEVAPCRRNTQPGIVQKTTSGPTPSDALGKCVEVAPKCGN
jgi:hypothetical protein